MTQLRPLRKPEDFLVPTDEAVIRAAREILSELFGPPAQRTFTARLWDGSVELPGNARPPSFTLVIRRPGALRRMLLPPTDLALGEAYLRDDFDVEGDIERAAGLADTIAARLRSPATLARLVPRLQTLPKDDLPQSEREGGESNRRLSGRRHSRKRDASAVRSHYDAGNDFYGLCRLPPTREDLYRGTVRPATNGGTP